MARLNIDFLIRSSIEDIISNSDSLFKNLLQEIRSYLNLEIVSLKVQFTFRNGNKRVNHQKLNFLNIGVKRTQKSNTLKISIPKNCEKFIRLILLKETYNCFLPLVLRENEVVNIFLNQKVEIDLQDSEFIEDWKELKRKHIINYEFIEGEFDRLEKFLKQQGTENRPSPFQFFFSYIRMNVDLIKETKDEFFLFEKKGFYDKIFEAYTRKYSKYPDEILETIRIIAGIFYKVKSYRSLLDYQHYFKEFKESGFIQTKLSLKRFNENMQWIKDNTYLAPSYRVNWFSLNMVSILCLMKFHPKISTEKVFKVIKRLPFFTSPSFSKNHFGIEILGYFIFPKIYMNDLTGFLEKLELDGYIIEKKVFILNNANVTTNLNCATSRIIITNPNKRDYKKEYEIEAFMDYGHEIYKSKLSLLDWLLIDRIRNISITGLGFERRSEALNTLKSDLLNEIESQRKLIDDVRENLEKVHNSPNFRNQLLELINNNQTYGFFYIKEILNDYVTLFDLISNILLEKPSIRNYFQFQEFIKSCDISKAVEDKILLKTLKSNAIREIFISYFKTGQDFKEVIEKYRDFYNLFKSFHDLKLFSLDSIKSTISDKSLIQKIYQSKEEKLKRAYKSFKTYKITFNIIEQRLEEFLNYIPPVIQPNLLGTIMIISNLTKFHPVLILKDTVQTREKIEKIKWVFPRSSIVGMTEHKLNSKYIYVRLSLPNLKAREKMLLYSVLYNLFDNDILFIKSYLFSGFMDSFSRKDFYDLEQEDFFYSKDLFEQFYHFVQKTFNTELEPISEAYKNLKGDLYLKQKSISDFFNNIENRISRESVDLTFNNLYTLNTFNNKLKKYLLNTEEFKKIKQEYFFRHYIKSIKFIPSFQSFGFGEYFIYFYPTDLSQIDFKHFLHNSFQKVKFPAIIDNSNSFLIKFIWPFRKPNDKILNWLIKSKKIIREYSLFFIKKVYQIFHFNYNLDVNEWDLDPNRFKIYFQNVLFNPHYNPVKSQKSEFNIGSLNISNYFTPESPEFKSITQLYNWKSADIKSYLGTPKHTIVNQIHELIDKKLIFPVISLKNLGLINKIFIILPAVKKEHNETLLKIFHFFNIGFVYEIEGEYFIQGFPEEIRFENGLMIKLYLPDCQIDEFEKLFDLIFEFLEIEHYVILNDLVDGKDFLKSIFGNLNFLKSYNPLKNLIWNKKDKIWMNHKLFTNKFEKIFPPLLKK